MLHQDWQPMPQSGEREQNCSVLESRASCFQTFFSSSPDPAGAIDRRRKERAQSKSIADAKMPATKVERHQHAGIRLRRSKHHILQQPTIPKPKRGSWERKSYISRSVLKNSIDAFSTDDSSSLEQVVNTATNCQIETNESNHSANVPLSG